MLDREGSRLDAVTFELWTKDVAEQGAGPCIERRVEKKFLKQVRRIRDIRTDICM